MELNEFPFHLIPAPLLSWFRANKRDLPWRENPTPYRVWVSEIMLQQTRVEAAKEYYIRFLTALPTVRDLAECDEEKLLKLWEGLGYYSRVRNMQKTAKIRVDSRSPRRRHADPAPTKRGKAGKSPIAARRGGYQPPAIRQKRRRSPVSFLHIYSAFFRLKKFPWK